MSDESARPESSEKPNSELGAGWLPSVEDLHAHFETLYSAFGPAKPTERLPAAILAYLDEATVNFYDAI